MQARNHHCEALKLSQELGDLRGEANSYLALATLEETERNLDSAIQYLRSALEKLEQAGSKARTKSVLLDLGILLKRAGNMREAEFELRKALIVQESINKNDIEFINKIKKELNSL